MQHAWEVFDLSNDELVVQYTRLVSECELSGSHGDDSLRGNVLELLQVVKQEMHERGVAHAIGRRLSKLPTVVVTELELAQPGQLSDVPRHDARRSKFHNLLAMRPPWLPEESDDFGGVPHRLDAGPSATAEKQPQVLGLWGDEHDAGDSCHTTDALVSQDRMEPVEAMVAPRRYRKRRSLKGQPSRVGVVNRMGFFVVPSRHRRQSTSQKTKQTGGAPPAGVEGLPQLKKVPPKPSPKGSSVAGTLRGEVAAVVGKRPGVASDPSRVRAKLTAAVTGPREADRRASSPAPMRSSSAVPLEKTPAALADVSAIRSGRPHSALATTAATATTSLSGSDVPPVQDFVPPVPFPLHLFDGGALSGEAAETTPVNHDAVTWCSAAAIPASGTHAHNAEGIEGEGEEVSVEERVTAACCAVMEERDTAAERRVATPVVAPVALHAASSLVSLPAHEAAVSVAETVPVNEPPSCGVSRVQPVGGDCVTPLSHSERKNVHQVDECAILDYSRALPGSAPTQLHSQAESSLGGPMPPPLPCDHASARSPPTPSTQPRNAVRGRSLPFPSLEHMMVDPTHFFTFDTQPAAVQRAAAGLLTQLLAVWLCKEAPLPAVTAPVGRRQQQSRQQEQEDDATSAEIRSSLREDRSLWYWVQTSHEEVYDLITGVLDSVEPGSERDDGWCETPPASFFWGAVPVRNGGLELNRAVPPACWNLWWTWGKPRVPHASVWLRGAQYVNHIPRSWQLTRKDCLKSNVQRFCKRGGLRSPFFIVPPTYQLPKEYVEFASAFAEERGIWIMKTIGMSRGRGISLVSEIDHVLYDSPVVVQRYVDRPLTIDGGYKFDLRLYVVVTAFQPQLEAFISRLGFARIAAFRYDVSDLSNKFAHLTNTSISHEAKNRPDVVVTEAKAQRKQQKQQQPTRVDTKWTLEKLEAYFTTRTSHQWSTIWREVKLCVLKALVAVEDQIPSAPCTFELFGFDVLVDESLRPWVLEINASPSLEVDCAEDEAVKPQLIEDVVALLNIPKVDRWALLRAVERRIGATGRDPHPRDKSSFSKAPPLRDDKATEWATEYQSIVGEWEPRELGHVPPQLVERVEVLAPSAEAVALQRLKRSCI